MQRFFIVLSIVVLVGCSSAGDELDIGTAVYVGDEMVKPYDPVPALRTPVTHVDRAKYTAIDIHCHWNEDVEPAALIVAMDERNVRSAINLSGGWGEKLDGMLGRYTAFAPGRLLIFANVDFSRIDEPDFADRVTNELRDARKRGLAGLKVFKNLGLVHRDQAGALIAVDDPRIDPIWAVCGELGMPVLIHSADPVAFFQPIDAKNERWMQLKRHPSWSFARPGLPSRDEVIAQRGRVMERHRGTNFIGAHVGGYSEDLAAASRALDEHPNFFMDISGRVGELGRQPRAAEQLLLEHSDRILFGTDRYPGRPDQPRYRIYYRFLETGDEYFKPYDHPFAPSGDWRIYGVALPDDVLRKVYHDNAARLLGLSR